MRTKLRTAGVVVLERPIKYESGAGKTGRAYERVKFVGTVFRPKGLWYYTPQQVEDMQGRGTLAAQAHLFVAFNELAKYIKDQDPQPGAKLYVSGEPENEVYKIPGKEDKFLYHVRLDDLIVLTDPTKAELEDLKGRADSEMYTLHSTIKMEYEPINQCI